MPMPSDTLTTFLRQPLTVRGRQIPGRLFLAPLSKLGNTAFREIITGYGGYGLLFSEMCWARSVPCGNGHDQGGFMWRAGENLQTPSMGASLAPDTENGFTSSSWM